MAAKLTGQTLFFNNPPQIVGYASIAGPEEANGPYGDHFDLVCEDPKCGEKTWEKGEKKMVSQVIDLVLGKANVDISDINYMFGGDLLNELITANFIARDYDIPFLGLYSACATMVEALGLGSTFMDGGFADCVLAFASSQYQTAERQYRTPLEYGIQYPPYKQWTITGAGAFVLGYIGGQVWIPQATFGKVIDLGLTDANDMGSAMAPAAADTILQHFKDTGRSFADYDLIITGDLGRVGREMLKTLLEEKGYKPGKKLNDCGALILDNEQKYGSGGSGAAASAIFLASVLIPRIINGDYNRIIVVATGALISALTVKQKETIPSIAHAVVIEKAMKEDN